MSDTGPDPELPEADLTDFEQQVVEMFEQRGGDGPADDATSPPSPGGGDGEQAPPSESVAPTEGAAPDLPFVEPVDGSGSTTPAPESQPVGGQVDTGEVEDSDGGDTPPPPVDYAEVWDGVDPDSLTTARAVYDWYAQLDEGAIQQIDAALSGQYVMVPATQIEQLQASWDLLERVRKGELAAPASDDVYSDDDTPVAPEVAELRARLEQLEEERMRGEVNQRVEQTASTIDTVYEQWKAQHPELTPQDLLALEDQLVTSGIYGPLAAKYGDEQATTMALDQILYGNPALREKALQPLVDQRLQQSMADVQEQQARGQRASAIAGSAPAPPSESAASLDPEEAMIEEIAAALRNT